MKNDAIFTLTRWVLGIVVVFLVTAFVILFFMPDRTGELFAWHITPNLSSMFLGAACLGGAWILSQVAIGKYWHRVHAVFPAVTVFTVAMLIATILHWDRFAHGNIASLIWVFLYIVSPVLIPFLWIYNRPTDTHQPEASDAVISPMVRLVTRILGTVVLLFITIGFLFPTIPISIWPWKLTPLTARILCGWLSVIGISAWMLSSDSRWTAWRCMLEGIFLAVFFILIAMFMKPAELTTGVINWFTGFLLIVLVGIPSFYLRMEGQRRKVQ